MATSPISSTTSAVADLSAGAAIASAAEGALRKAGATAATTVIDAIATAAAGELARAIAGAPAKKPSGTKKPATPKKPTTPKPTTPTKKASEFAFLDDKKMSIEEKLFRFLQLMSKKSNDDLVKKMKEFRSDQKSSSKGGVAGLWSALKKAVPALEVAGKLLGDKGLGPLLNQFSGPMLAAAATAVGMPALAPVLLKVGPEILKAAPKVLEALDAIPVEGLAGGSGSGTEVLQTTGAKSDGKTSFSKEEAMEIEYLMQQQQQLFAVISNTLKSMHDTKMAVINNIR